MRVALLCVVVSLACGGRLVSAQAVDEEAIKAVVRAETKAWIDRNADAWQATWLQDATASRVIVQAGSYTSQKGWEKIAPPMVTDLKENPTPLPFTDRNGSLRGPAAGEPRVRGVRPALTHPRAAPSSSPSSREYRVLTKDGGQWKIASQITHVVQSFDDTPGAIAGRINSTGQALLRSGKPQDAIEIFKLLVRLNPQSANAYNSLGEAYARRPRKTSPYRITRNPSSWIRRTRMRGRPSQN